MDFFKNITLSKFLEGIVLVTLLAVFGYFGKDVLRKFAEHDTSFSHSEEKHDVLDNPSMTFCFHPPMKSTAEKYYDLSPSVFENFGFSATTNYSEPIPKIMNESFYELGRDFIFEMRNFYSKEAIDSGIYPYIQMYLGENNVPSSNFRTEKVLIEKIYTYYYGMCYLVTPKYKIGSDNWNDNIVISMSDSLDPEDTPESIKLYLTSKDNQFGLIINQWLEGNVFDATMPYKKGHSIQLDLKQIKRNFLPLTSNCKEETAYDCLAKRVASTILDHSGHIICIPAIHQTLVKMAFNGSFELCEEGQENYRMVLKVLDILSHAIKTCPISCTRTEYVARQSKVQYSYPGLLLYWHFESTNVQVYQEYLIYDEIGMIGSIGGLLGLFLGFSFLNVTSYFIGKIQKLGRSIRI